MKKITIIVVIFLLLGAYIIIQNNAIDIKEKQGQTSFIKAFGRWILDLGGNIKDTTTYAVIEHDWLPKNNTKGDN